MAWKARPPRAKGLALSEIARRLDIGKASVHRVLKATASAIDATAPC